MGGRRLAKVLARVLVRRELDEELHKHPQDPVLRQEAARTEISRISVKRLSKLEVMTAGELARFLGVPVARIYHHVERGTIPHRRFGEHVVFSRRAVLQWVTDYGEL
jgi:excisionase family DNA binding protein